MDTKQEFIKQLLKEIGTPDDLDSEVYDRLVNDLSERLTKYINRRIIESLPEQDLTQLDKLFNESKPDQAVIQQYITEHVADPIEVTAKAMTDFRLIYLGSQKAN